MPTKKKRVGFIPRDDVMRIIDKLSIENNLSNSKIISILVEEALSVRGIFNKKNGKVNQSYQKLLWAVFLKVLHALYPIIFAYPERIKNSNN